MINYDNLTPGQSVIVRPAGYRTGKIVCRENGPLTRYWVRIDNNMHGPYRVTDLVHPDDPDRVGVNVR